MKTRKKIGYIIGIFMIVGIIYIASPKIGSFYNVILKQYKKAEFTEVSIANPSTESNYKEIDCTDKDTLDEILQYLKKLKIIEIRDGIHYDLRDSYRINLYFKKDDGSSIYNYTISIEPYDKNLEIIVVHDKYGFKNYKIINGEFDIKYIKNLIENKQSK